MVYEIALKSCIEATQDVVAARQANWSGRSTSLATQDVGVALKQEKGISRVEAYERIMKNAYSLVAAEATQTHNISPGIGIIFTGGNPPSYEQATCPPGNISFEFPSGVCFLKEQERDWRRWWTSLGEMRLGATAKGEGEIESRLLKAWPRTKKRLPLWSETWSEWGAIFRMSRTERGNTFKISTKRSEAQQEMREGYWVKMNIRFSPRPQRERLDKP